MAHFRVPFFLPVVTTALALVSAPAGAALAATALDAIVVRAATPGDVLSEDPIVPARSARPATDTGRGTIGRSLHDELPLAGFESSTPGGISQFRALGRSAEDVDVQALGVPLNGPQGGGFDYSVFPQFIWAAYRFQLTPSLSAYDPRGVGGSMVLTPWTQAALARPGSSAHASILYSDAGLRQFAAAASFHGGAAEKGAPDSAPFGAAVVAGLSQGRARGPSGALALTRRLGADAAVTFHLLATSLEADVPGSVSFPSPLATQTTVRVIPLLQFDCGWGDDPGALLKVSAFYDSTYFRNDNPDPAMPDVSRLRASQSGTESVLLAGDWKAGLSFRRVELSETFLQPASDGFTAPGENLLNLRLTRSLRGGDWRLEPTFQLTASGDSGALPAGSFGARRTLFPGAPLALDAYSRVSLSRRVPNLVDRYFNGIAFRGNPDLIPETDWTMLAGVSAGERAARSSADFWEADLQAYTQWRADAQVNRAGPPATVVNAGSARVLAAVASTVWRPSGGWEMADSVTWAASRLTATNSDFPYLPTVTDVLRATYRAAFWDLTAAARFSGSALAVPETGERVGGYAYLDLSARAEWRSLELTLRLENVFDRHYEQIRDYPSPGRAFVASLLAAF